jgi:hypothetical protein
MKVAFLATVLAILIGTLLLSMWMRKPSYEGFEAAPECTYSAEIPGYLDFCANNVNRPFNCQSFTTLDAAKVACSGNDNCRGITKVTVGDAGTSIFTIRIGGEGSTDYTSLEKMKAEMIRPSPNGPDGKPLESTLLITNLLQCKPGKAAAQKVNPVAVATGGNQQVMIQAVSSGTLGGAGMPPQGEFLVSDQNITLPASTLVAVPAGQTIFARRAGAGAAAGGATESTPAPTVPNFTQGAAATNVALAAEANLTAEEKAAIAGLPLALGLKIVDAVRRGLVLNEVLTADELATLRLARQGTATNVGSNPAALLTTPSLALSSQTTGTLTSADLLAIQQAAAAGAASAVNA